jgi:uncharacterized protein YbjT (DUF2867 family)
MKIICWLTLLVATVFGYDVTILNPPSSAAEADKELAVVWINGALSDPLSYVQLGKEFQA